MLYKNFDRRRKLLFDIGLGFQGGGGLNVAKLASDHISRVEADGGIVESEAVLKQVLSHLASTYSISNEDDFNEKLLVLYDPAVLGYKVGAGDVQTLGKAVEKLYSINSTYDLEQSTPANQPLLLRHNDVDGNYAFFPRERPTGETIRTRNDPGLPFTPATDTMVLTGKIHVQNQVTNNFDNIFYSLGWSFGYQNGGASKKLRVVGGTSSVLESSSYTPSATDPHWVRAIITPTSVDFEWSANGTSWTTIDSGLTPPTFDGTNNIVYVGYTATRDQNAGNIYYAKADNQTTGNYITLDMNDYDPSVSDATITSSYGDATVWNIQRGTAVTGLPMTLVDRSKVAGDGSSIKMNTSIILNQPYTVYHIGRFSGIGTLLGFAANSSLAHDGTNIDLNNGVELSVARSLNTKDMLTIEANGANSKIRINDGVDTEGDAGSNNGTYLDMFANGATYGVGVMDMLIISANKDSETIKEAMFNYFG